jgi:carbamoyltransferase
MVVMGLGFTDHEASVALVIDGKARASIALERITRLKKDGRLFGSRKLSLDPAIRYCLEQCGLAFSDVDLIVWNHIDHLSETAVAELLAVEGSLGFCGVPTLSLPHHFAHACASFYLSPYPDAAVLVADGTGGPLNGLLNNCGGPEPASLSRGEVMIQNLLTDYPDTAAEDPDSAQELESFYHFDGQRWHTLRKILGHYGGIAARYGAVSSLLFETLFDAGKTMGLAPFGKPSEPIRWRFLEPVGPATATAFRAVRGDSWSVAKQRIGLWRRGSAMRGQLLNYEHPLPSGCAAAVQREAEDALVTHAQWLRHNVGSTNLSVAGGAALNCVANSRIASEGGFESVFVPSAPGDDGIAIGCALYGAAVNGQLKRGDAPVFLGRSYAYDAPAHAGFGLLPLTSEPNLSEWTAGRLTEGAVIGWYQGGAELGPRALGHRSLLADPRHPLMRDHLNLVVKNRESFRPFAPIVLEHAILDFFEESWPSYFMSFVATVRREKRSLLPAITHVDGTSRYQVLRERDNPELFGVVSAFARLTGIPMLLNTSFNRAGEPIVETPTEAARCVAAGSVDFLVIDGHAWANPNAVRCAPSREEQSLRTQDL